MAPNTRTKSKAKKSSRPKSHSQRMKLPSARDKDTRNLEERASTPDSTHDDARSDFISDLLADGSHAFLFRSGTSDLAEVVDADMGSDVMSVEKFLSRLEICSKGLQIVLNRPSSNASALSLHVAPTDQSNREQFARYFEKYWTNCVMEYLTCEAIDLDEKLSDGAVDMKDEWSYAKLGREILYASGTITGRNLDIDYAEWCRFTPKCVNQDIQEVLCQLEDTYHSFQQRIYLEYDAPEKFKLWYLIWINLKKTFILFNQHENGFPNQFYHMEEELFTHPGTRSLFDWVTPQLDFFCPQEIEDLVGRYVKLVDRHLGRSPNVPLSETFIQSLSSFPEKLEWSVQAHEALHHAVIRLNNLTDGPSLLRRLGKKVLFFLNDQELTLQTPGPQWLPVIEVIDVDRFQDESSDPVLNTNVRSYGILSPTAPLAELNEAVNASSAGREIIDYESSQDETPEELFQERLFDEDNPGVVPPKSPIEEANKNSRLEAFKNYVPRGRNIISAYDYVHCPIPENRAYEVANSRLISRDLRTPGIISDGLRIEDLVNLPPPRCRTPGTWTSWKRRIPLGPFEVFGLLGNAIADRVLGRTRAPVTRPLAPPHVTSREECRRRKYKGKLAAKRDSRTRVTKPGVVQKAGLHGGGSKSTPAPGGNSRGPPPLETNPRYTSSPDDTPSRPPRPDPPEEQRPAPRNTDQSLADYQTFAATSLPPHDSSSALSQGSGSHNSQRENKNPFNASSPGTRVPSDGMRKLHAGQTPRVPLDPISMYKGELGESEEEEIMGPSPFDSISRTTQGVVSGDGGEPPISHRFLADVLQRCHPCPIYSGQYHHHCEVQCGPKFYRTENAAIMDGKFFQGSLWDTSDDEHLVRQEECVDLDHFIAQYQWNATGRNARCFDFSNGACIEITREPQGELRYTAINGPQELNDPSHASLESSGLDRPGARLLDLPDSVLNIDEVVQTNEGGEELVHVQFSSIDDLWNPFWVTGTTFEITYYSEREQDLILPPIRVRLARFESAPWEALEILSETPPPSSPHARDYDAIEGNGASEETRDNLPGYDKLFEHQSKLKGNQAAHQKKQDETKRQRREGQQPQDTTGHQDEQNVDASTDVPASPDAAETAPKIVTTQHQSQVDVVDAGQSTTKDAEDGEEESKNSKDDGKSKPIEGEPADEQPKKDDDSNGDDDGKGDNAAVAKPTAAGKEAPETTARGPRTRGAVRRETEAKAKKGNAGKKTQDNPTKPKTGKRKDRSDDSDDDRATTTKPKRK